MKTCPKCGSVRSDDVKICKPCRKSYFRNYIKSYAGKSACCLTCGKDFIDKSRANRKFCSKDCSSDYARSRSPLLDGRQCQRCSKDYNPTWKDQKHCSKSCAQLNRKFAPRKGRGGKGESHWASRHVKLRSPRGITYEVINLKHWVRNNKELFEGRELTAYNGLALVIGPSRQRNSWFGWGLVEAIDE